jgi:hypothetical protein
MFSPMKTNPASVGSGDSSGRNEAPLRTVQLVVDPHSSKTRAVAAALKWYLAFRGAGGCDGVIVVIHTIRGFPQQKSGWQAPATRHPGRTTRAA